MSTIHFPHYEGQTLLGDLREIDGTAIELGVAATEITPSLYSVTFTAVPDGLYRFIARNATRTAFNDTVKIQESEDVNLVSSESGGQIKTEVRKIKRARTERDGGADFPTTLKSQTDIAAGTNNPDGTANPNGSTVKVEAMQ